MKEADLPVLARLAWKVFMQEGRKHGYKPHVLRTPARNLVGEWCATPRGPVPVSAPPPVKDVALAARSLCRAARKQGFTRLRRPRPVPREADGAICGGIRVLIQYRIMEDAHALRLDIQGAV